jgi:hypothetical protein
MVKPWFVVARSPQSGRRSDPSSWIATSGFAGLAITTMEKAVDEFRRLLEISGLRINADAMPARNPPDGQPGPRP